jgi:hypothetical protein
VPPLAATKGHIRRQRDAQMILLCSFFDHSMPILAKRALHPPRKALRRAATLGAIGDTGSGFAITLQRPLPPIHVFNHIL